MVRVRSGWLEKLDCRILLPCYGLREKLLAKVLNEAWAIIVTQEDGVGEQGEQEDYSFALCQASGRRVKRAVMFFGEEWCFLGSREIPVAK